MASRARRRSSKELPPNLSELMDKLHQYAASFVEQFDDKKSRMTQISDELRRIAEEVKRMQKVMNITRITGAVVGGVGLAFAIIAFPLTGGASLAFGAVGGAAAAGGGAVVVGANITKIWSEGQKAVRVGMLGEEFMSIVKPLKEILENINKTCKYLKEESSRLQSERSLAELENFQHILEKVFELKDRSIQILIQSVSLIHILEDIFMLVVSVLRVTATPEVDRKLRAAIIEAADQSRGVISEFDEMTKSFTDLMRA